MENLQGIFSESFHYTAPRKPERHKNDLFSSQSIPKGAENNFERNRGWTTAINLWIRPTACQNNINLLPKSIRGRKNAKEYQQRFCSVAQGTCTLMKPPEIQIRKHKPILAFKSPSRHSKHQDSKEAETHTHLLQKTLQQATKDSIIYSVLIHQPWARPEMFFAFISW